jgi:rhodanese-related sulfurtransferase
MTKGITIFSVMVAASALVPSVKNLRPVVPGRLYRSATLDNLSPSDAELLLSGAALGSSRPLAAVIDLRNRDEIEKGAAERTNGSELFYSSSQQCQFLHIPLLQDVDGFWEEAINRMDTKDRFLATMSTIFQGGALDRAAARNLERGGHALLNTMIMTVGGDRIRTALQACLNESKRGPVIFHCQKGKDRTGVVGMLIQTIMDCSIDNDQAIISAYALSGECLGEEENYYTEQNKINDGSNGMIDWSYFRGSPAKGMADTLEWTRASYGSVEGYLNQVAGFDASQLSGFREQFV